MYMCIFFILLVLKLVFVPIVGCLGEKIGISLAAIMIIETIDIHQNL